MRIYDYMSAQAITIELQYNLAKAAAGAVRAKSTMPSYQQNEMVSMTDTIVGMQDSAADGFFTAVYEQYLITINELRGYISGSNVEATTIALMEVSDHLRTASDCATALDEKNTNKE